MFQSRPLSPRNEAGVESVRLFRAALLLHGIASVQRQRNAGQVMSSGIFPPILVYHEGRARLWTN
jgi:hypothetical protein